jgi:fucose 4-O-acetylase-like acetyltransferase
MPVQEERPVDTIAGLLAAASIFTSLASIFWHPLRLVIASILLALIAAGMSRRHQRLAGIAVGVGGLSWLLGMTLAVVTGHPLW